MVETGWEPEQVGRKTFDQLLAVLRGTQRRAEMMWGKLKTEDNGGAKFDGAVAIEQHLAMLKKQTGRTTFDLREVL